VKDWSNSFKDGYAFCALIQVHREDMLDLKSLKLTEGRKNIQTALEMAKKVGIPVPFYADDFWPNTPESRVKSFVLSLYTFFELGKRGVMLPSSISGDIPMNADTTMLRKIMKSNLGTPKSDRETKQLLNSILGSTISYPCDMCGRSLGMTTSLSIGGKYFCQGRCGKRAFISWQTAKRKARQTGRPLTDFW